MSVSYHQKTKFKKVNLEVIDSKQNMQTRSLFLRRTYICYAYHKYHIAVLYKISSTLQESSKFLNILGLLFLLCQRITIS